MSITEERNYARFKQRKKADNKIFNLAFQSREVLVKNTEYY